MTKFYKYILIVSLILMAFVTGIIQLTGKVPEIIPAGNFSEVNVPDNEVDTSDYYTRFYAENGPGAIDDPEMFESVTEKISQKGLTNFLDTLPTQFRLNDKYLFTTENQDGAGLCWAFATTKTVESFIAMQFNEYYNFSESWVSVITKISMGSFSTLGGGGNWAYYSSVNTYGMMLEADFPYDMIFKIGQENYLDYYDAYKDYASKDLVSGLKFKNYGNYNDYSSGEKLNTINSIKTYIQQFGSIYCTFNDADMKKDANNNTYVAASTGSITHAVSIIGWDDNYTAGGCTGAWILRNSWGAQDEEFYIMYDNRHVSSTYALINEINFNGYLIKTGNGMADIEAYDKIKLVNSNSNYSHLKIPDNQYLAKNLFYYTEETNFSNELVYSFRNQTYNELKISVFKGNQDVSGDFDWGSYINVLYVSYKYTGLSPGTYKIIIEADNDADGIFDETFLKTFVVFSGSEFSLVWTNKGSAREVLQNFNTFNNADSTANIYNYSPVGSGLPFIIQHAGMNNVTDYEVIVGGDLTVIYSTQPTFATLQSYTTGEFKFYLRAATEGVHYATLRVTTLIGHQRVSPLRYQFDYKIKVFNYTSGKSIIYLGVDYSLDGGVNHTDNCNGAYLDESSDGTNVVDRIYIKEPTRTNAQFLGWFYDIERTLELSQDESGYYITYPDIENMVCGRNYMNKSDIGRNNVLLYAQWEECKYTNAIIKTSGGTITNSGYYYYPIDATEITYTINVNQGFVLDCLKLDGLNVPQEELDYITSRQIEYVLTDLSSSHILEVYFEPVIYRITLTAEIDGGTIAFSGIETNYVDLAPLETATLNATANEGYSFIEWLIVSGGDYISIDNINNSTTTIQALDGIESVDNIVVSASFVLDLSYEYAINYNLNSGTLDISNPTIYTAGTETFSLNNPKREGYNFVGWSGTDIVGYSLNVEIPKGSTGTRSYTANWNENNYFIDFSENGGVDERSNKNPIEVSYSGKTTMLNIEAGISFAGKTLTGWQIEDTAEILILGNEYDVSYIVSSAGKEYENGVTITLNAVWQDNLYTIQYNLAGGTGTAPSETNKVASDTITTVSALAVSKLGYNFSNWSIQTAGGPQPIAHGTSFLVSYLASLANVLYESGAVITLTADWDITNYTILFKFEDAVLYNINYTIESTGLMFPPAPEQRAGYALHWVVSQITPPSSWEVGEEYLPDYPVSFNGFYGDIIMNGEYTAYYYNVVYDINGGTGDLSDLAQSNVPYDEENPFPIVSLAQMEVRATREHYHIFRYSVNGTALTNPLNSYTSAGLATLAGVVYQSGGIITIKIEWQGNKYSISYFIFNDDTKIYDEIVHTPNTHTYGQQTTLFPALEPYGKEFSGWKLQGSQDVLQVLEAEVYTDDIELYGEFTTIYHTVTLYDDSGEYLNETQVAHGDNYDIDFLTPTKEQTDSHTFVFDSWYDNLGESGTKITNFKIEQDRSFYAHFASEIRTFLVTFYSEDGNSTLQASEFEYGETSIYSGIPPTKEQTISQTFEFDGWSLSVGGTKIDATQMVVYAECNFFAHFEAQARMYTIRLLDSDAITELFSPEIAYETVININTEYIPNNKETKEKTFVFDGWYENIDYIGEKVSEITVDGDKTYYAKFEETIKKYRISFYYFNGEDSQQILLENGTEGYIEDDYGTFVNLDDCIPDFSAEFWNSHFDYVFEGWYDNSDLQGNTITGSVEITENISYYAKIDVTPNTYTLYLYDENNNELLDQISHVYGSSEIVLAYEQDGEFIYNYFDTKEGTYAMEYEFSGWFNLPLDERTGNEEQILSIALSANLNLYAGFIESAKKYEFTFYDKNGNQLDTIELEFGSTILISDLMDEPEPPTSTVQFAFVFSGWYDNDEFIGDPISEIVLTEDYISGGGTIPTTFYPKFEQQLRSYNVYFQIDEDITEVSGDYGTEAIFETPTKPSDKTYTYVFKGWTTEENPETPQFVSDFTITGAPQHYYAYFEQEYIDYTIRFFNGEIIFKTLTGHYNDIVNLGTSEFEASVEGKEILYIFKGWYENREGSGPQVTQLVIEDNLDLYAVYERSPIIFMLDKETTIFILIIIFFVVSAIIALIVMALFRFGTSNLNNNKKTGQKIREINEREKEVKERKKEIEIQRETMLKRIEEIKKKRNRDN